MSLTVETKTLPTQYIIVRVVPSSTHGPWAIEADTGQESSGRFIGVATATIANTSDGKDKQAYLRLGPFKRGEVVSLAVTSTDSQAAIESWAGTVTISNANAPATIVRQALFDILYDGSATLGAELLRDEWFRPCPGWDATPYTGSQLVVEIIDGTSTRNRVSPARAAATAEIELQLWAFDYSPGEAVSQIDNLSWRVQKILNTASNLYLSELGIMQYGWEWNLDRPQVEEDKDGGGNAWSQTMRLVVQLSGAWT